MSYQPITFGGISHPCWTGFGNKISNLHIYGLDDYHNATRYRLDIGEYSVRLLLSHYNNGIELATGWTSFLVQGKAAIDSFSQEVNLIYKLYTPKKGNWAMDVELLISKLPFLQPKNPALAQLLNREFGNNSNWFNEFKNMRDSEGVHRTRINRNLIVSIGAPQHRIQIRGHDVDAFSVNTILKINDTLETGYSFM